MPEPLLQRDAKRFVSDDFTDDDYSGQAEAHCG